MRIPIHNNSDDENLPAEMADLTEKASNGDSETGEQTEAESAELSADQDTAGNADEVKIRELTEKLDEMISNWQRERANFQNYKKRIEEEKREIRKYASYDLALDLLRILDYFESALSFSENLPKETNNVIDGVKYTIEELSRVLNAHGICPIFVESGMPYDSAVMEAVGRVERDDFEPDTVLEIRQKGWMIHERVLRPCRVIVAVEPETKIDDNENTKNNEGGENLLT